MTTPPRRIRRQQSRATYARVPDGGAFRTNSPDGYLADFLPVPTPSDASAVDGIGGAWWYGQGDAPWSRTTGSPLTERENSALREKTAMSVLPAVTRCTNLIVEAVVRTRWVFESPDGPLREPLWVDDPMLVGRAPGPIFPLTPVGRRLDGHSFWASILADAILWGRGAFTFIESADGVPVPGSLIPLNPFMVAVDAQGYVVLDRYGARPLRTDADGRFDLNGQTWRVAVLPGLYPNHGEWPEGVLLRHFNTFRVGAQIGTYLGNLFTSGVPSGYLSVASPNFGSMRVPDPDDESGQTLIAEQDLLKREWMRAHGTGVRSVAVLNSMVSYTPIAMNPVDAEAVKLSSSNRADVAHAFGLSSIWLDEGAGGLNYSNSSERRADLVNLTAAGWGEKLMRLISSLMPYGSKAGVNWITFISPSVEALITPMVAAVGAGIFTAHEARQIVGLVPWEGPDPAWEDRSPAANEPAPAPVAPPPPGTGEEPEETPENEEETA